MKIVRVRVCGCGGGVEAGCPAVMARRGSQRQYGSIWETGGDSPFLRTNMTPRCLLGGVESSARSGRGDRAAAGKNQRVGRCWETRAPRPINTEKEKAPPARTIQKTRGRSEQSAAGRGGSSGFSKVPRMLMCCRREGSATPDVMVDKGRFQHGDVITEGQMPVTA